MRPKGYNVHSKSSRSELLSSMGLQSIDELFLHVPNSLKLKTDLKLPLAMTEWEIEKHLRRVAGKNANAKSHLCFLGGGQYDHHVPAAVDALASRGEFLTAYTPYQPEMSQGLLQALYEYQQAIAMIIGLPAVNSSSYDGATALAEAAWMSVLASKKQAIAIAENVWPEYKRVLETYFYGRDVQLHILKTANGQISLEELQKLSANKDIAGVVVQSPNCYGLLEDIQAIAKVCHQNDALLALSYNPRLSGIFTPPGELDVDFVASDGQTLGLPLSAGGPSLGILATRKEYRQYLPGRIIGKVADIYGEPAYAMIYEDREQHVARERATSNLCSNQALCAIRSVIYLTLLGEAGFEQISNLNVKKSHYLAENLCKLHGVELAFSAPFFNEFLIRLTLSEADNKVEQLLTTFESRGIFAGINGTLFKMPGHLLVAVTENKSKDDLDLYIEVFKEFIENQ